jgi:DNA-binding CsgD family transcriptional regulator
MLQGEHSKVVLIVTLNNWGLSEAEKDIALLTIKGMTISEIAEIRNTKQSTIKTQSSAIYKKAGVSSRAQLVSLLIEELLK